MTEIILGCSYSRAVRVTYRTKRCGSFLFSSVYAIEDKDLDKGFMNSTTEVGGTYQLWKRVSNHLAEMRVRKERKKYSDDIIVSVECIEVQ